MNNLGLFLFKLHAPKNMIVGGGIFAYSSKLPCSLAWEAFGEANGARSAHEMRTRIAKYRKGIISQSHNPARQSDSNLNGRQNALRVSS